MVSTKNNHIDSISKKEKLESSSKTVVYTETVDEYVVVYSPIAIRQMKKYQIPASIILAQGILESGAGKGTLALKANNHFGIKCHKGWTGGKVYHDDDEKGECFRKYKHPERSYQDHSEFLTSRSRYDFLFNLDIHDYKSWAKGLRKAGYATDQKYANKLISLIERYSLYNYDLGKLNHESKNDFKKQYTVKKGDTLYSIAKQQHMDVLELKRKNKLKSNTIYVGQVLLLN